VRHFGPAVRRWPVSRIATTASIVAAVVTFVALAYSRRWMSDDGLIVVRVAREIAEGYGPTFNVFERAEPNTSALWLGGVAMGGLVTRGDFAYVSVILGGVFATGGLVCALDAVRRFHRVREPDAAIVPCGALIVLGVFPFWDYATAGLETGLAFAWVSASFWLLVTLGEPSRRRQLVASFVLGLGTLVRPDLALVSGPMLVALWWLVRPRWQRTLVLLGAAFALPVGYSIFRAGYYGVWVPLPALAKSASSAHWSRGLTFVGRFVGIYLLWIPLAALALLLGAALKRAATRDRVLIVTPIVCGLALVIYVARMGGDFMHGRMLLVPTWLIVLPAMALPLRRWTAPVVVLVAGWALVTAISTPRLDITGKGWAHDWDERETYVEFTRHQHPIDPALFVAVTPAPKTMERARAQGMPPLMIWDGNGSYTCLDRSFAVDFGSVAGRLGRAAASVPAEGLVIDLLGLANPLGARITVTHPGQVGHEKLLPAPWVLADFGEAGVIASLPQASRDPVEAAKRAMQCGELAELFASVREPLTVSRFFSNLVGAWRRTRLVVPSDPALAERRFCR